MTIYKNIAEVEMVAPKMALLAKLRMEQIPKMCMSEVIESEMRFGQFVAKTMMASDMFEDIQHKIGTIYPVTCMSITFKPKECNNCQEGHELL